MISAAPRFRDFTVFALLAAALLAAVPLKAQVADPPNRAALDTAAILASARPDIDAANDAWLPGLQHRDADAIVAAYADSGLFIGGDGSVIRGRSAIARMYAAGFPHLRPILGGGVQQEGLTVLAPTRIAEWGRAWIDFAPARDGDAPLRRGGSYLTVWERGHDGHWQITRNVAF